MSVQLTRRNLILGAAGLVPVGAAAEIPSFRQNGSQFVFLEPMPQAPAATLVDVTGKQTELLGKDGRSTILYFGATWCPPCRVELPKMHKEAQRLASSDPRIFPVMVDREGAPKVVAYLEANGIGQMPVFVDPAAKLSRPLAVAQPDDLFVLRAMPISYVISPRGQIVGYMRGAINWRAPEAREFFNALSGL